MKPEYKLLLFGWLTIALFDAISSIASRLFNFNDSYLCAVSFIIYGIFGFLGTRQSSLKIGVLIAAAVGFFDATAGWAISILLKANTGNVKIDLTIGLWIIAAIFVTGTAALCGLIAGALANAIKKKEIAPK